MFKSGIPFSESIIPFCPVWPTLTTSGKHCDVAHLLYNMVTQGVTA